MLFKSILILFSVITLSYSRMQLPQELEDYVDVLHKQCIQKSGITEEDHAAYDIVNNPHDKKLTCYMKCLMLDAEWMKPDGVIRYDWIIETAHPEIKDLLVRALNQCRNIQDSEDLCEKASHFNSCMYQADKENWFLP